MIHDYFFLASNVRSLWEQIPCLSTEVYIQTMDGNENVAWHVICSGSLWPLAVCRSTHPKRWVHFIEIVGPLLTLPDPTMFHSL